tara:strand:+ start:4467 stop:5288 length:822 start_codon:yes stop_codon:yes gene_type:complete
MNVLTVCAQVLEKPREVYTSNTSKAYVFPILIPKSGPSKSDLDLEYWCYGATGKELHDTVQVNDPIHIQGANLRHDLQSKLHSIHGGFPTILKQAFRPYNQVILSGTTIKTVDDSDERQFKITSTGLIICNQTIAVTTGKGQSDLFNVYAISNPDDRYKLADWMCKLTKKGKGITISGKLVCDSWKDKQGNWQSRVKIQVDKMTLPPADRDGQNKAPETKTVMSEGMKPGSLWADMEQESKPQAEPYGSNLTGLPDLPDPSGSVMEDGAPAPF